MSVVVIALLAVLAGAGGPTAIARWRRAETGVPLAGARLAQREPRKDVFRRVLMALRPAAFQACFADWLRWFRRSNNGDRSGATHPGGQRQDGTQEP